MILIQSLAFENVTDDVLDWIFYNAPEMEVRRINDTAEIHSLSYSLNNSSQYISIKTDKNIINTSDIRAFWYRRGHFSFNTLINESLNAKLGPQARSYLQGELDKVTTNINSFFYEAFNGLNKADDNNVNKLEILRLAVKVGLTIPDTLICTDKDNLFEFITKHKTVLSKVIFQGMHKQSIPLEGNIFITHKTKLLTEDDIQTIDKNIGNSFLPSLIQQYIDKKFELRIFYLMGDFYPMAIFSQENEKTKIDYRNYDYERPNRCVPYKLPAEIEDKVRQLMEMAGLTSGSIDMIYSTSDTYVFLEVNPIGQFQALGRNCNYYLDKEIANHLVKTAQNAT